MKELGDLELRMLPKTYLQELLRQQEEDNPYQAEPEKQSLIIEHYECCHKPLPEFSNIENLSLVHYALGFLPEPTSKEVLLEEIDSDEEDSPVQEPKTDRIIHCIKVINGELFLFCNIKTRAQFKTQNQETLQTASSCEVVIAPGHEKTQPMHQNNLSLSHDFKMLVDSLTLPMNEDQLYRN